MKHVSIAAVVAGLGAAPALATEEINLLTWCDHTDRELLEPFEEANDVRVNVKVYELTGAAISLLDQSRPGDWDVFMVDTADVARLAQQGILAELSDEDLPIGDLFDGARMDTHHVVDGKRYGVPEKFGFNTIAFDQRVLGDDGSVAMRDLYAEELTGKVAIYDYYWPIILQVGQMNGIAPAEFDMEHLDVVRDDLFALKDQAQIVGDIVATQTSLNTGDAVALIGAAEWVAGVKQDLPHLNWTIQEEGGVRWSQSLALFESSEKKDMGLKFIQYLMSPEGQARVATASCYWGFPANSQAALSEEQKEFMRFADTDTFLANAEPFPEYKPDLDTAMIELWTEFLAR